MIPQVLHRLVRLTAIVVSVTASGHYIGILVIGEHHVGLVAMTFVAQSQHIVRR